jgi:hypothetical protein
MQNEMREMRDRDLGEWGSWKSQIMWLLFSDRWGLNLADGRIQTPISRAVQAFDLLSLQDIKPPWRKFRPEELLHK